MITGSVFIAENVTVTKMWPIVEGVTASSERETQSETQTGAVAHEEKREPSLVVMPAPKSTSQQTTSGGKVLCEICKTPSHLKQTKR